MGRFDGPRRFLATHLFTMIHGMHTRAWMQLLREHRLAIDPPYWPRHFFILGMSLLTSAMLKIEHRTYKDQIRAIRIQPPIFILGHWRSGTTYLHNLLALDPQFAYSNLFQTLYPHTFLTLEGRFQLLQEFVPRTRLVDNIPFGFGEPQEDEFALCNATLSSPYMGWAFPRYQTHYDRYLTMHDVSPEELEAWKQALLLFLRKLTWKYNRPLLLKSPPHTCRIKLLLELFPDAKFIHICREPYTVFQSTRHLHTLMFRATTLQNVTSDNLDDAIIRRYRTIYDAFFEEQSLIPEGQYCELRFEDLERDPVKQVEEIYQQLNLNGFGQVRPTLERYVKAAATYRKNEYPPLPEEIRNRIIQVWQPNFEAWGYKI